MFRKFSVFFLALLLCVSLLFPVPAARADGFDMSALRERYVILVDASDPTTALYGLEKNADERCATGSTIKILSCLIALEQGNPEDVVTISASAVDFSKYNSLMGLQQGEQWTLKDLLYGLMLPSGNDAAVAIAEHIAGSTTAFAKLMNDKAAELGMTNSHFVTVHGKDKTDHYSTARDMAKLTAYALQNEKFREIVSTKTYTCADASGAHSITLTNTDRLLVDAVSSDGSFTPKSLLYPDAIGVKTGDTNAAGKCFVGAATRGGTTLIAVLLGGTLDDPEYLANSMNMREKAKDPYNAQRFEDAIALFDYAFKQMSVLVTVQDLINAGMPVSFPVQVQNYAASDSNAGVVNATARLDTAQELQLMKPFYDSLMADITAVAKTRIGTIAAPISEGDVVGTVEYVVGDTVLFTSNLYADRSVSEGILSTQPSDAPAGTDSNVSLIGSTTTLDGAPVSQGPGLGSILLYILIGLVVLALIGFVALVIVARIRREKRRRERAARRRRQQRMERMNREGR